MTISKAKLEKLQKAGAKIDRKPGFVDPATIALEKLLEKLDSIQPQTITVENNVDIERLISQQNMFINGMMDTLKQIVTMKQPEGDDLRIVDIEYEFGTEYERGQIVYKTAKSHVIWGEVDNG